MARLAEWVKSLLLHDVRRKAVDGREVRSYAMVLQFVITRVAMIV